MEIRLARHGRHVAVVTLDNQPRLNAMTRQMLIELGCLWDELERDGDCRCIVLTGPVSDPLPSAPISAAICRPGRKWREWSTTPC
jgi:hypothetical protein